MTYYKFEQVKQYLKDTKSMPALLKIVDKNAMTVNLDGVDYVTDIELKKFLSTKTIRIMECHVVGFMPMEEMTPFELEALRKYEEEVAVMDHILSQYEINLN